VRSWCARSIISKMRGQCFTTLSIFRPFKIDERKNLLYFCTGCCLLFMIIVSENFALYLFHFEVIVLFCLQIRDSMMSACLSACCVCLSLPGVLCANQSTDKQCKFREISCIFYFTFCFVFSLSL